MKRTQGNIKSHSERIRQMTEETLHRWKVNIAAVPQNNFQGHDCRYGKSITHYGTQCCSIYFQGNTSLGDCCKFMYNTLRRTAGSSFKLGSMLQLQM